MRKFLCFALLLLTFTTVSFAGEILLGKRDGQNHFSKLDEQWSQEQSYMDFSCEVTSIHTENVDTQKGVFTKVSIGGFHQNRKPGTPQLPIVHRLIEVPLDAEVSAEILEYTEAEINLPAYGYKEKIFPAQPSVRKTGKAPDFSYDPDSYKKKYSKGGIVELQEVGLLRNYRVFALKVKVANYNALENKIKIYDKIKIRVHFKNIDLEKVAKFKEKFASPAFDRVCQTSLIPSDKLRTLAPKQADPLKYLIISDPAFRGVVQSFVDHKLARDYAVVVKYTDEIGKTTTSIEEAVDQEYNNPVDGIVPTFLLIVGDKEQVPAFSGKEGSHVTDLYYAAVGNDDYLPDLLSGRFSAQNIDDLIAQVDKTIAYEKGALANYAFLSRALLVAGWDSYWATKRGYPHIRYGLANYFNQENGFKNLEGSTYLSSKSHENESEIRSHIDQGVGIFNYTAHGTETSFHDPGFTNNQVQNLTNNGMYPLVIGNCCLTNAFEVSSCFGETWLRKKNGGAIGFIGGSSFTYWDEDLWWGIGKCAITNSIDGGEPPHKQATGVGAYDTAFEQLREFTNCCVMLAGNLAVLEADSHLKKYYFEVYHLMGDPGLPCYWAIPGNPPTQE